MSDEVVKIDNSGLARLIKEELEKKGIKKNGINEITINGIKVNMFKEILEFKKEELEQFRIEYFGKKGLLNDFFAQLPNLRKLKISSVNMRTMRKDKMMILDNRRYNYESKLSGIKDFSVIEKLEKLEFLQIDNEENLRKINTENLKNLVSLKLREVRGLDFNEELSELDLEHNRRR